MNTSILFLTSFLFTTSAYSIDIEAIRKKYAVPAIGGLRTSSANSLKTSGLRRIENSAKVTNADLFHLGSITKTMTSMMIGLLIDQGKIQWSMTLKTVFPDLKASEEFLKISIEQLSSHTSGLPGSLIELLGEKGFNELRKWDKKPLKGRQVLLQKLAFAQLSQSGEYVYSNAGYTVLGIVIEKILNQSWEAAIKEILFAPLNMNSCGIGVAGNRNKDEPNQPWGHLKEDSKYISISGDNPIIMSPAGGVHCRLEDFGKWVEINLLGFQGKSDFLKKETFFKLYEKAPQGRLTYGSWIYFKKGEKDYLQVAGSNTLNFALAWIIPHKNEAYIAVTNAGDDNAFEAVNEVILELMEDGQK